MKNHSTRFTSLALACAALAALAVALLLGSRALDAQSLPGASDGTQDPIITTVGLARPSFHPSRVLVRFRPGTRTDFVPGSPAVSDFPGERALHLVENPPGMSVADAVGRYRANPNVLYAEPDYLVHAVGPSTGVTTPNDPLWRQQWDMVKIAAPTVWNTHTDSSAVVVAVIDTGIDFTHPDLQGNLWTNADGSHGYDCIGGACAPGGGDVFGHGTHVAGTIGAVANNGIGIAGINWRVQLMSLRFMDASGNGYISDAVLAVDQATTLKQQGVNVRVTNNSWGGGGFSQALKDAMSRAESAGILHVCAAGNSNQDADSAPMYPAAYDNRGIVSVLATDKNDVGATFTNYGLATVDIAAPGVSTISTVPAGTCPLCDKSGYKALSGTSMATPHVTGVLAALFQQNPGLTAAEARDVVLDPRSYDGVTDPKAQTTTTGGRLNFAKALANPLLAAPLLNNFPVLTMGPNIVAAAGSQVTMSATPTDADRDPLRIAWSTASAQSQWLFGWMLGAVFPPSGASPFAAPSIARTATIGYDASVADGRGGSAQGRQYVTVLPGTAGQPPSGTLSVSPTSGPAGSTITVSFAVADPDRQQTAWDMWVGMKYAARGACCFTGGSATVTLADKGVYRIGTQAIDQALNLSSRPSVVVRIGGATGEPPIAIAALDKSSGPVPLTVNIDMSGSYDPDGGKIATYYFMCEDGSLTRSRRPQGSCTYTTPGTHWIQLLVQDSSGYVDQISAYVNATPGS